MNSLKGKKEEKKMKTEQSKNKDLEIKNGGEIEVECDKGERLNAICAAFPMKKKEWKR
jgi:hypothetical protein